MKTARLTASWLALSAGALLLTSCLDYREELWINGDASGKIHATIAINSELGAPTDGGSGQPDQIEAQLRELFAVTDGAKVESYQTFVDGKKRIWDFTVSFKDLRLLKPAVITGKNNIGAVFGDFEIEKIPDGKLAVKRTVSLSEPPRQSDDTPANPPQDSPSSNDTNTLGNAVGKLMGGLLANSMFSGYHLDYTTHFPTEVVSANSPSIDRDTNTVSWRFPLAEASQHPVTMTAEIKRPGGWLLWLFIAILVVTTLAILLPAFRKKPVDPDTP
ncbi:MAG: hypothetical protein KDM63_15345 [Verrucomicrobiae bacterium]|nr:hypothetical protein [Verrucomicrobiae bacterium]